MVKNNQDIDFNDIKLFNVDGVVVNREPSSDNELASEKFTDNQLDKNTFLRFNQTLENYLKVSVGNNIYNLTKYDKIKITDAKIIKYPNSGGYLFQI